MAQLLPKDKAINIHYILINQHELDCDVPFRSKDKMQL